MNRFAKAFAYGGGGLGLAGALLTGLLFGQAQLAKRAIPDADRPPPDGSGHFPGDGMPIRLVMLGDSSAAGLGVDHPAQTPGALIAASLGVPVEYRCFAVVGAESGHLAAQIELASAHPMDIAIIVIGGNDVTHGVRPALAVRLLADAVRALRELGAEVVVGTCPDLGTIQPIQPPLRWVARQWSRQLAAMQTRAVEAAGGRAVQLGALLGPEFAAAPAEMFSADRFHPSAAGYAAAANALLPAVRAALIREPA
ncbi:SGNH/GDSL hydrolase family protein [Longispora albida]|uniref:SGNH/GDSL hydrolase family protein n=1 Tax=Longispora albida TaxID=203523 RepID=UPI000361C932|nr:SGNH/GDSL hydrolase family protein [Longispora albida]